MPKPFNENQALGLIENPHLLVNHSRQILYQFNRPLQLFAKDALSSPVSSAVLFLLGIFPDDHRFAGETCLVLNKRSSKVKQPGDLCFPGGSVSNPLDPFMAKLLYLPGSPLLSWPYWPEWRRHRRKDLKTLMCLLATGLREGFEEMRLNPLLVNFLGPMPPAQLVTFRRKIYPMVCWVVKQKQFYPNREVESVVRIPLRELLQPDNYAGLRMTMKTNNENGQQIKRRMLPCYLHKRPENIERLWGATYRMIMAFLDLIFGFKPPELDILPVVKSRLDDTYLTGKP